VFSQLAACTRFYWERRIGSENGLKKLCVCSETIARERIIRVSQSVKKTCTNPWKSFAEKSRLNSKLSAQRTYPLGFWFSLAFAVAAFMGLLHREIQGLLSDSLGKEFELVMHLRFGRAKADSIAIAVVAVDFNTSRCQWETNGVWTLAGVCFRPFVLQARQICNTLIL